MLPCLSLFCLMTFGPAGLALGGNAAPGAAAHSTLTVQAFGRENPQCHAWTNQCVTCTSAGAGNPAQCSTPGIACTPGPIRCTATR